MSNQSSHPVETVLLIAGFGLAALYVYSRFKAIPAQNLSIPLSAPVTVSSATFPPSAAPTGYYWAPQRTGGYGLQPLSNPYGVTGIQQSALAGIGGLIGGGIGALSKTLFGSPTGSSTGSIGNLFGSIFGGSSSSPSSSFQLQPVDPSLSFPALSGSPSSSFDSSLTGPLPTYSTNPLDIVNQSSQIGSDSFTTTDAGLLDTPGAYAASTQPDWHFGSLALAATP